MKHPVRLAIVCVAAAAVLADLATAVGAQQKPGSSKPQWAAVDLLPLTCAQAWVKAGKSYPQMRSIVVTLARVSLANRDLKFPDTREAGLEAGRGIAQDCKADPNGLLFASVDKRVRAAVEGAAAVVK